MYCKQSKNTFIRIWGDKGYITNQLTRYDRLYNDIGAFFLSTLSRTPQKESSIIDKLQEIFGDSVERQKLEKDFEEFILDLQSSHFIVRGSTEKECEKKDIDFSYSLSNIKTKIIDFSQKTKDLISNNTYDKNLQLDQKKPRLKSIQFELTSRCNERCIHCYIPNYKKDCGKDMPFDCFCKIIDQFVAMGGLHVSLSGGEVFLHKDIMRCIQYCREKDLEICILSNLLALKDEQIPILKDANISYIQASLYSMDAKVHDSITTIQGSQQRTQHAIEKLIQSDIPIQISCPIMKVNKDSFSAVLKYAQKNQIKAFSDYIMMGQADLCTDNLCHRLSLEETENVIRSIIEFDLNYSRWVNNNRRTIEDTNKKEYAQKALCGAGLNNLCISAQGEVYPCPGWQTMVVGNINQESLCSIWENSPQLSKIRTLRNLDFPQCLDCEAKKYCSKCLERNSNENNGNMYKVSKHFCDVAFLTKRLHEEYQKKRNIVMIFDSHIHIGQYYQMYTSPKDVMLFMDSVDINMAAISSTSTCENDYDKVIREMNELCYILKDRIIPILWLTPMLIDNHKLCNSILQSKMGWRCVKIHPQFNIEFSNPSSCYFNAAIAICKNLQVPMLIHSGVVNGCRPITFESYFIKYPEQIFILAHGRPIDEAILMLQKYPNVYVDTAFMPISHIIKLINYGFHNRILWGSDYPIFKYFDSNINAESYYKQLTFDLQSSCDNITFEEITILNAKHIFQC